MRSWKPRSNKGLRSPDRTDGQRDDSWTGGVEILATDFVGAMADVLEQIQNASGLSPWKMIKRICCARAFSMRDHVSRWLSLERAPWPSIPPSTLIGRGSLDLTRRMKASRARSVFHAPRRLPPGASATAQVAANRLRFGRPGTRLRFGGARSDDGQTPDGILPGHPR